MDFHKVLFSSRRSLPYFPSRTFTGVRQHSTHPRRRRFVIVLKATSPTSTTLKGSKIGWMDNFNEKFVLERSLGHGSFGEVWSAIDRRTREKVAVKQMPKTRGRLSIESTFAKIEREVSVMKDLTSCPAAVQFKECHALPSSYRIVMEYCDGLDLKGQIRLNGPVSERLVAFIAFEILMILKLCHKNGIIHGDVKTANFMLRSKDVNPFLTHDVTGLTPGWLKGIDFGCSQYLDEGSRISRRVGTPVFMAPEVFDRDYGLESDLWSLGVVLYQLFTGKFPFWNSAQEALTSSLDDVMDKVQVEEPDFNSASFGPSSVDFLDFMKRLLEKDYKKRMTVEEALEHPFMKQNVDHSSQDNNSAFIDNGSNIVPTTLGALHTPMMTAA